MLALHTYGIQLLLILLISLLQSILILLLVVPQPFLQVLYLIQAFLEVCLGNHDHLVKCGGGGRDNLASTGKLPTQIINLPCIFFVWLFLLHAILLMSVVYVELV